MEEALLRCNDSHLANANMTWLSLSFREVAAHYKSNVCIHVALSELGLVELHIFPVIFCHVISQG